MRYKFILRFVLILYSIQGNVFGQNFNSVAQIFNSNINTFSEKIFIHTDKPQYLAGEFLWFKLYNVNYFNNKPSNLSKVAYIELLDKNNTPKSQEIIELKNGLGDGSIYIPHDIETGIYKFRAYTNLMKNSGPNTFFEKQIFIINSFKNLGPKRGGNINYDIQFFPEGGDMINNISSNVAFKVVNSKGLGTYVKGIIINEKNDTVATLSTLKFGIGRFKLTPTPGAKYKAICITSNKEVFTKELPPAKKDGYVLRLIDNKETVNVYIESNRTEANVFLFANNGKQTVSGKAIKLVDGKGVFSIEKSKLMEGLSYFTLFTAAGKPVAERLFFKSITKKINLSLSSSAVNYLPREKVTIGIRAQNETLNFKDLNTSFAVYKIDSLQKIDDVDILSYIHLTSELTGNIEQPSYYFSSDSPEVRLALDNLLLTHGWRRFNWEQSRQIMPMFKYLPEYAGHLITGKIVSKNQQPVKNMPLYLSSPTSSHAFYRSTSDSLGNFIFNVDKLFGKNELIVQTNSNIDSTSNISVFTPFYGDYNAFTYKSSYGSLFNFNDVLADYHLAVQVQDVYSGKFLNNQDKLSSADIFYGTPYKSYTLDDYTKFNTVEDVLREYITGVFVTKKRGRYNIKMLAGQEMLADDPLVLYDGVPFFNVDNIMAVDPFKIERLEIIQDKYYYNGDTYGGILNFISKKAILSDYELSPNAVVIDYEGLQIKRQFYAPSYTNENLIKNTSPDFRNVLYWQPNITINNKSAASVSFYTSDMLGKYVGVIQGLSDSGIPAYSVFQFEVKK